MSLMTSNCEIVDNVACGQSFQYCRTHKVESKDCPGAKKVEVADAQHPLYTYQALVNKVAATIAQREFKVGDKVSVYDVVRTIVEGDVNYVGTLRSSYEAAWGPAVLCDNGYFYRAAEVEHV